jgi:dipeptidyl aminopeptidase/acylaminoacyl peptidase
LYKTKGGRGRSFFADDYLTHIWRVPTSGGEPELITPGDYNEHSLSWSPDGSQLAFISNRSEDPDNNQYDDLWTVDIKSKAITRLTNDHGTAFQPSWSPDGKYIAYLATTGVISTNDSPAEDTHLYLIDATGGLSRSLTKSLDRRIENITWSFNGSFIYFTAGNYGMTPLFRVSVISGTIEEVIKGKFHLLEFSLSNDAEMVVYTSTCMNQPAEIFLMQQWPENRQHIIQVTHENDLLLSTCLLQDAETFWFKSFDETNVQGWLMKPALFTASGTYPLVLVIHGGPHNMFGYEFEERMQLLSANGYGVLFINPRGSSGYGQTFSMGCVLNWGGGDYKDVMAGLDYVINENSWIDKERLCVTGQSYGGYLTNWIITQTNRFKAAVVDGGISNLVSFSGTSLYHSLMESEFNGNAYDNYPLLWQWSPLRNVKNVKTPTLFLHGQVDNEVPISQAEEMYVALKKLGVKTSFVQYIGEGHGWRPDLKPGNRVDMYNRIIDWFNQVNL